MVTTSLGHLAIFASYERVFARLDRGAEAGATRSGPRCFDRAIWHYTTVLEARGADGRGVVPRRGARRYFARMHADFAAGPGPSTPCGRARHEVPAGGGRPLPGLRAAVPAEPPAGRPPLITARSGTLTGG